VKLDFWWLAFGVLADMLAMEKAPAHELNL
jgi:hypothetical protein